MISGLVLWAGLRNTPRASGMSPAQMVFGHPIRANLVAHQRAFAKEWQPDTTAAESRLADNRAQASSRHDMHARTLPQLQIGTEVRVQDAASGRWDRTGTVVSMNRSGRSYVVELDNGRTFWRNRRYLRPK